jgi:hypothetical protein
VEEARGEAAREVAAAVSEARARVEVEQRACAAEVTSIQERARDAIAMAAVERDRQEGERARAVSLERLEWMRERQAAEEGAWWGIFPLACMSAPWVAWGSVAHCVGPAFGEVLSRAAP